MKTAIAFRQLIRFLIFILFISNNTLIAQQLNLKWNHLDLGARIGRTGLITEDLNQDGQKEILVGDYNYFSIVSVDGNTLDISWTSKLYNQLDHNRFTHPIVRVRVIKDVIEDTPKIYVLLSDGQLDIYDGTSLTIEKRHDFNLDIQQLNISFLLDFEILDVDGDGQKEIVILSESDLKVYDLQSFVLEDSKTSDANIFMQIADLDFDQALEIIVAQNPSQRNYQGYVLDGGTFEEEWTNAEGFGSSFTVGDIDQDSLPEIIAFYRFLGKIQAFDPRTKTSIWNKTDFSVEDFPNLFKAPNDSFPSLYFPTRDNIKVYEPLNFEYKYSLTTSNNIGGGVSQITIDDIDQDGEVEIITGIGYDNTGSDHLFIIGSESKEVEWNNIDQTGPFYVNFGDVDGDNQADLVVTSYESACGCESRLKMPKITVFDPLTYTKKREIHGVLEGSTNGYVGYDTQLVNVDEDSELEIIIGGLRGLTVYDYATDTLVLEKQFLSGFGRTLSIGDVDRDGVEEIVMLDNSGKLTVFNKNDLSEKWAKNLDLESQYWLKLGQLDEDDPLEMVIVDRTKVLILDGMTQTIEFQDSLKFMMGGRPIIADMDLDGKPDIIVKDKYHNFTIVTHQPYATTYISKDSLGIDIPNWHHSTFEITNLDQTPEPEIIIQTDRMYVFSYPDFQYISQTDHSFESGWLDKYGEMIINDLDNDGVKDIWVTGIRGIFHYLNGPLTTTSIEEETNYPSQQLQISTYPNPFRATFHIEIETTKPISAQFGLYNLSGKKLWERFVGALSYGKHLLTIDDTTLPQGVYILSYNTSLGQGSRLIIKR